MDCTDSHTPWSEAKSVLWPEILKEDSHSVFKGNSRRCILGQTGNSGVLDNAPANYSTNQEVLSDALT